LPIVGAFVRVLARISIAGRSRIASGRVARTDDRGVYRISGIEPGDYYIQVPSVQAAFPAALSTDKLLGRPDEQASRDTAVATPLSVPPMLDLDSRTQFYVGQYPVPARSKE